MLPCSSARHTPVWWRRQTRPRRIPDACTSAGLYSDWSSACGLARQHADDSASRREQSSCTRLYLCLDRKSWELRTNTVHIQNTIRYCATHQGLAPIRHTLEKIRYNNNNLRYRWNPDNSNLKMPGKTSNYPDILIIQTCTRLQHNNYICQNALMVIQSCAMDLRHRFHGYWTDQHSLLMQTELTSTVYSELRSTLCCQLWIIITDPTHFLYLLTYTTHAFLSRWQNHHYTILNLSFHVRTRRGEACCKSDKAFRTITSQISTWW